MKAKVTLYTEDGIQMGEFLFHEFSVDQTRKINPIFDDEGNVLRLEPSHFCTVVIKGETFSKPS